jgi:Fe-S-cluster-containing dehydrogenase component
MDRIDQGLEPACVAKCVTKCLHFGKPSQMIDARRERHAKAMAAMATEVTLRQPVAGPKAKPIKPKRKKAEQAAKHA